MNAFVRSGLFTPPLQSIGISFLISSRYSGSNCEIDVDACSFDLFGNLSAISDRCYNGGTCKDGPGDRYFCVCPPGFSGAKCETFLNPCRSSPCLNDGLCQPDGHRFKCICPYGKV